MTNIDNLELEEDDGSPVKSLTELSKEHPELDGLKQQALAEEEARHRVAEEVESVSSKNARTKDQ